VTSMTDIVQIQQLIQELLCHFMEILSEPQSLPPRRVVDHQIPLIPGAQPVNVRPYHYSPQQKNEIGRQVGDMLQSGVIQLNSSPFASSVLLVKMKDGSWHFYVDYRALNALTIKNKHPLPMVEEMLDELAGDQWFTKLDLRSGYHQIRMAAGDEYKTAFRTHQGLNDFFVIPFGFTNALATF
jgi:hypothetical protein